MANKQKEHVQQLAHRATELQEKSALLADHPLLRQFLEIVQEWHDTHLGLEELERQLQSSLTSGPPPKLVNSVSVLENWIRNVDRTLLGDSIALTSLDVMEEQIKKYTDIEATVNKEEANLHDLNNTAEDLLRAEQQQPWADSFERQLSKMNKCWHNVTNTLADRIRILAKHIDSLRQFLEEVDTINNWMDGVGECEEDRDKRWSMIDLDQLEVILEKAQSLRSAVASYQPNVDSVNFVAEEMMKQAEPQFAGELRKKVVALNQRWDKLLAETVKNASDLKDAIHTSDSLTEEIRSLYRWIEEFEKVSLYPHFHFHLPRLLLKEEIRSKTRWVLIESTAFPPQETFLCAPMELGVDVQARIKHLQGQREKKMAKNRAFEKVERQYGQMVKAGRVEDVEDLKEDLEFVKAAWLKLESRLDATEEGLRGALPKLAQFKSRLPTLVVSD